LAKNYLGHESLLDAKILHRDISVGNVMLYKGVDDGFLVDLDLAVKIDRGEASGAPSKTGTKVFMAIGVLYGEDHNFMHDLESLFWVLFWLCIHSTGSGENRGTCEGKGRTGDWGRQIQQESGWELYGLLQAVDPRAAQSGLPRGEAVVKGRSTIVLPGEICTWDGKERFKYYRVAEFHFGGSNSVTRWISKEALRGSAVKIRPRLYFWRGLFKLPKGSSLGSFPLFIHKNRRPDTLNT
jgi:hypothetical protein